MAEDLDIEKHDALRDYLRRTGRIDSDEQPLIRTLLGGVSSRTVLIERPTGEAWVLKQSLSKLRVDVDWFGSPERIHREALGNRWLARLTLPGTIVPLVFEDHTFHLLAMQAVPHPHDNWKTLLLAGRLEQNHVMQFAQILGNIHRGAYERRDEIAPLFDDRFFESLRLEPYYRYTATQVSNSARFYKALIDETHNSRVTLVHGDYSPKNVLVRQGRLILLDHEVIHFGDPAFDLGFSMAHLLSKAHHIHDQRAAFSEAARHYWCSYFWMIGDLDWAADLESRAVRHTLGCLLARAAGRVRLEYLDADERARQCEVVVALMQQPPVTISDLIDDFIMGLEYYARH